ncbi:unnamed protein product [Adineta steineri]|uniref:TIL domain-containing protein n=1 Tax=Adineta steineri TaxID=433720 RepID=A0A818UGH6_9BILA|nr:unnamed protein product [Adineta steineri]CAF3698039.1 unnamed protein product [Adineta steineri]
MYVCVILVALLITLDLTVARRRRKACDNSKNEVYSTCGNLCKQMNCHNRANNDTYQPCNDQCRPGCICKLGYVRHELLTDPCIKDC